MSAIQVQYLSKQEPRFVTFKKQEPRFVTFEKQEPRFVAVSVSTSLLFISKVNHIFECHNNGISSSYLHNIFNILWIFQGISPRIQPPTPVWWQLTSPIHLHRSPNHFHRSPNLLHRSPSRFLRSPSLLHRRLTTIIYWNIMGERCIAKMTWAWMTAGEWNKMKRIVISQKWYIISRCYEQIWHDLLS